MKKFNIYSCLLNRDAVISTIWSVLQQLVVAASTYLIVKSIQMVTAGDLNQGIQYISAFVISLVLVYLPNTLSMAYLQRWRLSSIEKFVNAFIDFNKGKTTWGHSRNKVIKESWLTNESFAVFDGATGLLYQLLSTLMNSLFNIMVIAWALDSRIMGWYAAAGAVLVGVNYISRGFISKSSLAMQESRNALSSSMLSAWQNIFIGNKFNFENWHQLFSDRFRHSRKAAASYDITRSVISSITVCVALLIVALGNGIFLWENQQNIPAVAALFITMPRQLQIIQSIFSFFNLTLSWNGVRNQLKTLEETLLSNSGTKDSLTYVQIPELSLTEKKNEIPLSTADFFFKNIQDSTNGRRTLRGPNGTGKSTLLSVLKEKTGDSSFMLPTNYEDLSFSIDFLGHSDGNRLLAVFEKIAELESVKYIILDEWDANLDGKNLSLINDAIERLAETKVIIESRHRG